MPSASTPIPGTAPDRGLFSARVELVASIIAGVLLLTSLLVERALGLAWGGWFAWASLGIGMIYGGRAALLSLRAVRFDIDVLMALGAGLAAYLGAPAEGALLLFLFTLSGSLEELAMERTTRAVEALHRLMPSSTLRLDPASGSFEPASPETLIPGDMVRLLPGDLIPADCELAESSGSASVDQANLTGESMPREVRIGEDLFAGTVNLGNPIVARVKRPAKESSLQRVLNLVISAQQQREPVQRFIDRLSQPYALGVLGLSITLLLVWRFVLGVPWVSAAGEGADGRGGAIYTAITLLIVMSPCAVIISTPTATLASIGRAARAGVLFKGGQSMERLARLGALALDKTGTLTLGKPRLSAVIAAGGADSDELLNAAAALERDSTHPIASAIRKAAAERGIDPRSALTPEFHRGRGLSGTIDGVPARLGTLEHASELLDEGIAREVGDAMRGAQARGEIAVALAWGTRGAAMIISDELRPGAATLAADLRTLRVDPLVMLTGDNEATAGFVAKTLGISRWHAQLLPEDKVAGISALKAELHDDASRPRSRRAVGVIGDGVNDAPALAAADVSIAIGSIGSDAAMESADIVLLADDLAAVPWALRLARRTRTTILLNLTLALGAIAFMAVATITGSLLGRDIPLWAGVLGHEGGTLLVVGNSLLILTMRGYSPSKAADRPRNTTLHGPAKTPGQADHARDVLLPSR